MEVSHLYVNNLEKYLIHKISALNTHTYSWKSFKMTMFQSKYGRAIQVAATSLKLEIRPCAYWHKYTIWYQLNSFACSLTSGFKDDAATLNHDF